MIMPWPIAELAGDALRIDVGRLVHFDSGAYYGFILIPEMV
jgi:hypothetical protein